MSTITKKAIMKALVEGVLTELMVKTQVDNVYLDDTTTLATKLAEMVSAINERAKSTDVTKQLKTAVDNLIGGAPSTYDTLKEIADYIEAHEDVVTALNAAIGAKADKSVVDAVKTTMDAIKSSVDGLGALAKKSTVAESDLDPALKTKITSAAAANHSHANKSVLDGITADKVKAWDGKGTVFVQVAQPTSFTAGDLWIQTVDE